MSRRSVVTFGATVLILIGAVLSGSVSAQGKWWRSDRFIQLLDLSPEQGDQMEAVFQSMIREQWAAKEELDRQEARFSDLLRRPDSTEVDVMAVIDEVEAARSKLGKLRALMLYRMRRVLTLQQRTTLEADRQRAIRDRARGGQGDRSRTDRDRPRPQQ
jgi:Spy/CpxP family protein refolding chaperone